MKSGAVALLLIAAVACGRRDAASDSTARQDSTTAAGADWVADLGPVLVIQGDSQTIALAVNDPLGPANVSVRVARLGGAFGDPVLAAPQLIDSSACDAPHFLLSGPVPRDWTVGVASNVVASVSLDSIEALTPSDSAALAAEVARVASGLAPEDTRLRGLPFVALKAYRIQRGDRSTLFASVLRRLPQEATPLEARSFVIAEAVGKGPYSLSYGARSEASEETVEHFALLGVLRVADKEFAVLEREQENGTQYEIIERSNTGEWRVRWSRALGC